MPDRVRHDGKTPNSTPRSFQGGWVDSGTRGVRVPDAVGRRMELECETR